MMTGTQTYGHTIEDAVINDTDSPSQGTDGTLMHTESRVNTAHLGRVEPKSDSKAQQHPWNNTMKNECTNENSQNYKRDGTPTDEDTTAENEDRGRRKWRRRSSTPVDQKLLDEYDASETLDGIFAKSHCYQALVGHRKFATFPIQYDSRCVSPFQCEVTGVSWNSWNMAWVANWYEKGKLSAEYFHTDKNISGELFDAALEKAIAKRKAKEAELSITPRKGARGPRYTKEEALQLAIQARNEAVRRGDIIPKSIKRARFRSGVTGVIWNDNNMAWQAHWKENGRSHVCSYPTSRTTSGEQFENALENAIAKRREMEVKLNIKPRDEKGKDPPPRATKRRKLKAHDYPTFEEHPKHVQHSIDQQPIGDGVNHAMNDTWGRNTDYSNELPMLYVPGDEGNGLVGEKGETEF